MKYYLDTEFIEGFHKPLFGKKRHFIDLISIGIVAEDGREYEAISSEYTYSDADEWVQKNVILPLYLATVHGDNRNRYTVENFHTHYGKPNEQIAKEVIEFIYPIEQIANYYYTATGDNPKIINSHTLEISDKKGRLPFSIFDKELEPELDAFKPEFYAYYADYDWVLFCSIFGRMIDLPKGFPMYCRDLKQMIDETLENLSYTMVNGNKKVYQPENLELHPDYPKEENEHSALDDAKWNQKLHQFLLTL